MTAGTAAKAVNRQRQMNADRTALTDAMRAEIEHMPPGRKSDPGVTAADNRHFPGGFRRLRARSPRRGLPERFGNWDSVFVRFRRWTLSGGSARVFNTLSEEFDFRRVCDGGAVTQARRKASGAKGGPAVGGSGAPEAAWRAKRRS